MINFENGLYEAAHSFFEQAHTISPGIHLLKEYREKLSAIQA